MSVKGIEKVIAELDPKRLNDAANYALKKYAVKVDADAKRLAPVDEGRLRNSIGFSFEENKVTFFANTNYAAYIEFGTRSYAAQYVASLPSDWQTIANEFKGPGGGTFQEFVVNLTRWVQKKLGIRKGAENVAYAIAKKIVTEGIPAQPFLYPAITKNENILREEFLNYLKND